MMFSGSVNKHFNFISESPCLCSQCQFDGCSGSEQSVALMLTSGSNKPPLLNHSTTKIKTGEKKK